MKIKHCLFILFLLVSANSYSQPDPRLFYPEAIKKITAQLKTDSLNYKLIWERLNMSVSLLDGEQFYNVFVIFNNETSTEQLNYYKALESDFKKVYDNVVKLKNHEYLEEGDYFMARISFYGSSLQLDKAIADAYYLKDSASNSKFYKKEGEYNGWALESLFRLFVLKKDYDKALETINAILEEKKGKSPKLYFTNHGAGSGPLDKINLFEYFDKKENIITYLKQLCRENFNWYFEKASFKDTNPETLDIAENEYYTDKNEYTYFMGAAKTVGFDSYLVRLIYYMKKFNSKELPKYEKIYNQLRYRMNENYETINPKISDKELKAIVSEI